MYFQVILHLNKSSLAASISCNLTTKGWGICCSLCNKPKPRCQYSALWIFLCVCVSSCCFKCWTSGSGLGLPSGMFCYKDRALWQHWKWAKQQKDSWPYITPRCSQQYIDKHARVSRPGWGMFKTAQSRRWHVGRYQEKKKTLRHFLFQWSLFNVASNQKPASKISTFAIESSKVLKTLCGKVTIAG